jgi:chromatin remodeling complex protein RSC6
MTQQTTRKAKATKRTTSKTSKTVKSKKASKTSSKKKTETETTPLVVDTSAPEEVASELPRLEATRESITAWFDKTIADVEREIKTLRQSKCPGGKFLKSLNKTLKGLKTKSIRVMGKKPKKRSNVNSGFLKQVAISKEMAKFIGCSSSELKSRVDVTKHICAYIKENNLQNPKDKREILPDAKLKKLLRVEKGDAPLTYYRVQSKLKPHFS